MSADRSVAFKNGTADNVTQNGKKNPEAECGATAPLCWRRLSKKWLAVNRFCMKGLFWAPINETGKDIWHYISTLIRKFSSGVCFYRKIYTEIKPVVPETDHTGEGRKKICPPLYAGGFF